MSQDRESFPKVSSRSSLEDTQIDGHASQASGPNSQQSVAASSSTSPYSLFSASSQDNAFPLGPQELVNEIMQEIASRSDDWLMIQVNKTLENKILNLKEAADLFYSLALVFQSNKELSGAAITLQLEEAQHLASSVGWYFDRLEELKKIAAKICPSIQENHRAEMLIKLLSVSEKEIELISILGDPALNYNAKRQACMSQAARGSLLSLLLNNFYRSDQGPRVTIMELGSLPAILSFFRENDSHDFRELARNQYQKVSEYRNRHTKLLLLLQNGKAVNEQPNLQIEPLSKFLKVLKELGIKGLKIS